MTSNCVAVGGYISLARGRNQRPFPRTGLLGAPTLTFRKLQSNVAFTTTRLSHWSLRCAGRNAAYEPLSRFWLSLGENYEAIVERVGKCRDGIITFDGCQHPCGECGRQTELQLWSLCQAGAEPERAHRMSLASSSGWIRAIVPTRSTCHKLA